MSMVGIPNTVRKAGVYYFRRVLPGDVCNAIGRRELVRSLRTSCSSAARSLARELYIRSEELICFARSRPMLSKHELAAIVQHFYAAALDRDDELRLLGTIGGSEADRQASIVKWRDTAARFRGELGRNRNVPLEGLPDLYLDALKASGSDVTAIEVQQVKHALLRGGIELAEAIAARYEGEFNYEPRDELLKASAPSAQHTARILGMLRAIQDGDQSPSVTEAPKGGERTDLLGGTPPVSDLGASNGATVFSAVAEVSFKRQALQQRWSQQTTMQSRATVKLFQQFAGDKPLSAYSRGDIAGFRDALFQLPGLYAKLPEFRGMTIREIIEAAAETDHPRLSTRTVQRHLSTLSGIWDGAVDAGLTNANIIKGLKLPRHANAKLQRDMWRPEQLESLFHSPIWKGCKSDARRADPGKLILRDEKFWVPLISLFSGMRLEEICQINVDGVRQERDVWVFDINDHDEGRRTKTKESNRLTPIHSELVRFGFLAFVDEQRRAGHDRIFSGLTGGGADLRFGHNLSKFFARYRRAIGIDAKGVVFHSLRHTAITLMNNSGAPEHVVAAVVGHKQHGQTSGRYTKYIRVELLRDVVETIRPEVDLEHLVPSN